MSEPRTLPEIVERLADGTRAIESYFPTLPAGEFLKGDATNWGPAHHLSHLTLSNKRVGRALGAPAQLPQREESRSRTYSEIRKIYEWGLPRVPREKLIQNPVPPRVDDDATPEGVLADYVAAAAALRAAAATWSEADADVRTVQHPFMGPLSVREMLCFIAIHDAHHLRGVQARFGPAPGA